MKIVVALGGNALARRGEPMTVARQRRNVVVAAEGLAPLALKHDLIISHGNGPQVGLLALQAHAYDDESAYPFDVMGAQTEGMIGYFIEQELGNLLPMEKRIATLLTMVEVDPKDPAFDDPTKFVGPVYDKPVSEELERSRGWSFKQDGNFWRRVVPSPEPKRIFELDAIKLLVSAGMTVVCAGGGGIPTMYANGDGKLSGVEAVIDKDLASSVLARDLQADLFVIATDTSNVFVNWGQPDQKAITKAHPDALEALEFPAGSMGPKVGAAVEFARATGNRAVIGALSDLDELVEGTAGTQVSAEFSDIEYS